MGKAKAKTRVTPTKTKVAVKASATINREYSKFKFAELAVGVAFVRKGEVFIKVGSAVALCLQSEEPMRVGSKEKFSHTDSVKIAQVSVVLSPAFQNVAPEHSEEISRVTFVPISTFNGVGCSDITESVLNRSC